MPIFDLILVIYVYKYMYMYRTCITGNFRGVQFSQMFDLYYFEGLIFADGRTHSIVYCTIELILRV